MKKVLLTCGAGASSGFMAQRMRQAAADKNIELEVKAVSESELKDYLGEYDILLVGPHLKYKLEELTTVAGEYNVDVQVIDDEIYGKLDGGKLLDKVLEYYKDNKVVNNKEDKISNTASSNVEEAKADGFMGWMQNSFAPKMNKIASNKFIKSIQDCMLLILPFVMVGSLISILNVIKEYVSWIPDLSMINSFSFGLFSLFLSFLVPYKVMDNYGKTKFKYCASLSGVSLYLLLILPTMTDSEMVFVIDKLGAGGMLVSLFTGVFVSAVMLLFSRFSFFKKDTNMPDIVVSWTDSMIPVFLILLVGVMVYNSQIDVYTFIQDLFSPIFGISQSLGGIIILCLSVSLLYSFGISSWVIFPVIWTIWMQGIAANETLAQAGQAATNLNLMEFFHGFVYLGGTGATLALVVMMFFSKSLRLKAMGRLTIVPSLLNINEPVVFGTPIALNPLLMIPMWIIAIVLPVITYFAFTLGFVNIPTEPFQVWYLPVFIYSFFATQDVRAIILVIINLAVSAAIYYPFFKVYEKQEIEKERLENGS